MSLTRNVFNAVAERKMTPEIGAAILMQEREEARWYRRLWRLLGGSYTCIGCGAVICRPPGDAHPVSCPMYDGPA